VTDPSPNPPGWHPDPSRRFELRYWDGTRWTEHVSTAGRQQVDAGGEVRRPEDDHVPVGRESAEKVQKQVARAAGDAAAAFQGGGTLLTEPVLVVNQKAKLIEITNQYAVYDQHGTQIGAVQQVGQSTARKALRLLTNVDQYLTHKLEVKDMAGAAVLTLTRPAKVFKSTVVVGDATGAEVGRIVQENMVGKIRFRLEAAGQAMGSLNAENWRAWNFSIKDQAGVEVARITKTWAGLAAAAFTTADRYVVQIHRPLDEPLRSLVVAAALCVDTALKQDDSR
jgi:uncharacterized protein YxjI